MQQTGHGRATDSNAGRTRRPAPPILLNSCRALSHVTYAVSLSRGSYAVSLSRGGSDWVIDIGPGAGEDGGRVVAAGPPAEVARVVESRTAPYLWEFMGETTT